MSSPVKNGLILGGILAAYQLLMFGLSLDKSYYAQIANSLVSIVITIIVIVLGIREQRNSLPGGFISFGKAFAAGFTIAVTGALVITLFTYPYMTWIDPDMVLHKKMMQEEEMIRRGMSEAGAAKMMARMEFWFTPGMFMLTAFFSISLIGSVISLIAAAILKKENPEGDFS